MILDEKIPRQAERMARYLGGEMDEAELASFEQEFLGETQNRQLLEEMKKQWSGMGSFRDERMPDPHNAWNKLHGRLEKEQLLQGKVTKVKFTRVNMALRIAATFLVLIGAAAILYYNLRPALKIPMENIVTGNEQKTLIRTLTDGSVIFLAQNTSFSFPKEFSSEGRNVELNGEAFFDIARDESKPFRIETDEAIIQVMGTAFTVKTRDGSRFELLVERGKVKVTSRNDPSQVSLVIAGEKITSDGHKLVKSLQSPADHRYWYKNHMHFKDETLQNIINVLNRNFNLNFAVSGNEVGSRRLTVTFADTTVTTMTELICQSLSLQSQINDGTILLSPARGRTGGN